MKNLDQRAEVMISLHLLPIETASPVHAEGAEMQSVSLPQTFLKQQAWPSQNGPKRHSVWDRRWSLREPGILSLSLFLYPRIVGYKVNKFGKTCYYLLALESS